MYLYSMFICSLALGMLSESLVSSIRRRWWRYVVLFSVLSLLSLGGIVLNVVLLLRGK